MQSKTLHVSYVHVRIQTMYIYTSIQIVKSQFFIGNNAVLFNIL